MKNKINQFFDKYQREMRHSVFLNITEMPSFDGWLELPNQQMMLITSLFSSYEQV